jgi:hypothetical protein
MSQPDPEIRTCLICDRPFEPVNDFEEICQDCQCDEWMMIDDLGALDDSEG